MKKKLVLFLICSFSVLFADFHDIELKSEIAFLMDLNSRHVLYEKNADQVTAPASITKIATALYALKEIGDDFKIKIKADQDCVGSITDQMQKDMNYNHPPHWLVIGGTHMSIAKGEELSMEELLYGLMLVSANDSANVIAKYIGGSISQFMADLNDYLEEIGCEHTHFRNPHGLHFPNHQTTARDMALITAEAMKYPFFKKLISADRYVRPSSSKEIYNFNLMIRPDQKHFYPYALGGKTGIHSKAKSSLVAVASHHGRDLVVVLMQCPEKTSTFEDAKALFEKAFSENQIEEVYLKKGPQPFKQFVTACNKKLYTYLESDVALSYFPSEKPKVKGEIYWHDPKLPIHKGDVVATLSLKDEQEHLLKEVQLLASHKLSKKSLFTRVGFYLFLILLTSGLFYIGRSAFKSSFKKQ